ncbi:hypothetical protein F0562_007251 [Nyssa sinensis]|uniref:Uncharacterized protein n=1 Tax=Nyssa sinensis TaxID=561372 RepID=A0A5J5A5X0_9ASTE|nr:hypothetical protein F0562_007251 [Nyssa sinensis]
MVKRSDPRIDSPRYGFQVAAPSEESLKMVKPHAVEKGDQKALELGSLPKELDNPDLQLTDGYENGELCEDNSNLRMLKDQEHLLRELIDSKNKKQQNGEQSMDQICTTADGNHDGIAKLNNDEQCAK